MDQTSSARPTSVVLDIELGQEKQLSYSPNNLSPPPKEPSDLPTYTQAPTTKKAARTEYRPLGWLVQLLDKNPTAVRSGRYSIKFRQLLALFLILLVLGGLWFSKNETRYGDTLQHLEKQQQQQQQEPQGNRHEPQPQEQEPHQQSKDAPIAPHLTENTSSGDDKPVPEDSAPPPTTTKEDRFRDSLSGKALERYDRVRGKETRTSLPKIQFQFPPENDPDRFVREGRQTQIRDGFAHAWKGYKDHAWGHDEVQPVAGGYRDSFNGWGATLIDSLDTLVIMGFNEEFDEALEWIKTSFDMTKNPRSLSFFETVIRYLGGLLSAYDLTGEKILLDKAEELGGYMLNAFVGDEDFPSGKVMIEKTANSRAWSYVLAEIGTIQVEFTRLSTLTKNPVYDQKAQKIIEILGTATSDLPGILPSQVTSGRNKSYGNFNALIGGMADSYYEYLLKEWVLLDGKVPRYRSMFETAMDSIKAHMVSLPDNGFTDAAIIGSVNTGTRNINTAMDHLSCFIAGSLAMGAKFFDRPDDMKLAQQVAEACYLSYRHSESGVGPEFLIFSPKPEANGKTFIANTETFYNHGSGDNYYILRPETVESLWILYRLTGEKKYQEQAWEIFQSIEKNCRTKIAYSGLKNVNEVGSHDNKMESFFVAETMKYLYLMFSEPNVVSLDDFVFNTEAHPVRRT